VLSYAHVGDALPALWEAEETGAAGQVLRVFPKLPPKLDKFRQAVQLITNLHRIYASNYLITKLFELFYANIPWFCNARHVVQQDGPFGHEICILPASSSVLATRGRDFLGVLSSLDIS
jgi:hypothetical protein